MNNIFDVIIIGAGISGVYCALNLNHNLKVLMLDSNEMILKKFKITGNGYANITNNCDIQHLLENIIYGTKKFMYYGFKNYGPDKILNFLKKNKIKFYQRENTTKIFLSESNKSAIEKFNSLLKQNKNLKILLNSIVTNVDYINNYYEVKSNDFIYKCKQLVVATGGLSFKKYAKTDGFGYVIAKKFNHPVDDFFAMGVDISLNNQLIQFRNQIGTSFKNTKLSLIVNKKIIATETGDLMITHDGLGGPVIRRISSYVGYNCKNDFELILDILPINELTNTLNKINQLKQLFNHFDIFTKKFITNFYEQLSLNPNSDAKNFNKNVKNKIIKYFTNIKIHNIKLPLNIEGAISTGGGVNTKLLNPQTFESKIQPKLYFIGETNNTNALTGGFNLTVCFSSAMCCSEDINKHFK